jgi:hypothetical protein
MMNTTHQQAPAERPSRREPGVLPAVAASAVTGVLFLHGVTLVAAFTRTEPHPPLSLVPFIAATAALGVAALPLLRAGLRAGSLAGVAFALVSMISFGPHKLLLGDMPDIAPAVIVGFSLATVLVVVGLHGLRRAER